MLLDNALRCNPPPGKDATPTLSAEDRQMLEAVISPEVIAARGYYTARRLSDVPDCFPRWQRRLGLVIPSSSPAPGMHGYQLRPKRPRHKGPKYETPSGASIALDANPLMLEEVRHGSGELWVTEGAKKVDALASRGVPAVGGTGVWNFAMPGSKGTEPLPCWRHVKLRGRTLIFAFDADSRTNADVQEALKRNVTMLEKLGAVVLVADVPEVEGDGKAGVDDYLAAGGDLEELRASARPFEPADIARERMSRDEKFAATVGACWRRLENMPASSRAECSNRSVMRDLVRNGERIGKVQPEGLLVVRSSLDGAVGARMSERAWWKSIERLEASGELRRAKWGPKGDRAGAYLLTPWGEGRAERAHYWREATHKEGQEGEGEKERAQSFPLSHAPYDHTVHEARASGEAAGEVPALRWPKVVHTWKWRKGRRVVVDSDYIARIGKQGEEVIRYVLEHDGATVAELLAEFGSRTARPRDFRRRRLGPLVDRGIVAIDGEDVSLTAAWREALERARLEGQEIADNRLQAEKAARRKQERREHFERMRRGEIPKADPTPLLRGKKHTRETLERNHTIWQRERVERERERVGTTAAVFIGDTLEGISGMRWTEMRQLWRARGGSVEDLRHAVNDTTTPFRLVREKADDELYVYATGATTGARVEREPVQEAPTTPLLRPDFSKPEVRDGIYHHGSECSCVWCDEPMPPPRYATPAVGIMP